VSDAIEGKDRAVIVALCRLGVALAIATFLASCEGDRSFGPVVVAPDPVMSSGGSANLETGDKLRVVVYGEDSLSGAYEISPAGTISMPLIRPIPAVGRTTGELERALAEAYRAGGILKDPKVTVSDVTYRPVYVFGEVQSPGRYSYVSGLDVLTAVATAGGFTYRASRTAVFIRHPGEEAWREYSLATPLPVAPGDLIRVPERYF
jgi:protein involved in polysaccharide export with SLBB domain